MEHNWWDKRFGLILHQKPYVKFLGSLISKILFITSFLPLFNDLEKVFLWKWAGNHSELSNNIKLGSFSLSSSLLFSVVVKKTFVEKSSLLETLRWRHPLSTTRTTTNDRAHDLIFQLSESLSFYFIFFFFLNCISWIAIEI